MPYARALLAVILVGIASRVIPTNSILVGKYLGDALYATMLYLALGLLWPNQMVLKRAALALMAVIAIECFQLTGIPGTLSTQSNTPAKLLAIALGTQFSWLDLVAYLPGIALPAICQHVRSSRSLPPSKTGTQRHGPTHTAF